MLVYPAGIPVLVVNALFEAHAFLPTTIAIFCVLISGAWQMLLAVGIDRLVGVVERWG